MDKRTKEHEDAAYRANLWLHRLWSKSGTTEYVKEEWKSLQRAIEQLIAMTKPNGN
jgi:hypothetical protein